LKEKLSGLKSGLDRFIYSDYFLLFTAVFVFVFHIAGGFYGNVFFIGAAVLAAFPVYLMFSSKDLSPFLPVLVMLIFMTPRGFEVKLTVPLIVMASVLGAAFAAGIVVFLLKNRPKFKKSRRLVFYLIFSGALLLSGLFSKWYLRPRNFLNILQLIGLNAAVLIFLFTTADKLDFNYVAKIMVVSGLLIVCELAFLYILLPQSFGEIISNKLLIHLGWGNSNSIGITLGLLTPAAFYLAYRKKRYIPFVAAALVMYVAGFFTMCRNSILITSVFVPIMMGMLFFLFKDKKKRVSLACVYGACAITAAILLAVFFRDMSVIVERLKEVGLNPNGRDTIFREALDAFVRYPVFGVGFAYDESYFDVMYIVHNTILQYLASTGIAGFLAWGAFTVSGYLIVLKNRTPGFLFMLASLLISELCGMAEPSQFIPYIVILNAYVFTAAENKTKPAEDDATSENDVIVPSDSENDDKAPSGQREIAVTR
jgi:O-antigen ligase